MCIHRAFLELGIEKCSFEQGDGFIAEMCMIRCVC